MLILVSGGSGSGKSEFAESLVVSSGLSERIYLATMQVWDEESVRRVERHRQMRSGKGFTTLECPTGLDKLEVPAHSAVLLEDLSNLSANEYFAPEGGGKAAFDRVLAGIEQVAASAELLVVVTNELFSDGVRYDPETAAYLELLAALNRAIAAKADQVYEVVCGIPVAWKEAKT